MIPVETREALSRHEAAELYSLSADTIQKAIHSGHLKAKRVGRVYRIGRADLRAWFESLPDA